MINCIDSAGVVSNWLMLCNTVQFRFADVGNLVSVS